LYGPEGLNVVIFCSSTSALMIDDLNFPSFEMLLLYHSGMSNIGSVGFFTFQA